MSPQSPGVGNQFHEVAALIVYAKDIMIANNASLSKVPTVIFLSC